MNEDQILSEYLDGELPPDLSRRVEQRFERDPAFRERYDELLRLRSFLKVETIDSAMITDMQAHVWQQVQRQMGARSRPWQHWLAAMAETLHRRIIVPLPALAAMLVVVLTLGIVAIARSSGGNTANIAVNPTVSPSSLASTNTGNQSIVSLPSTLGVMPLASKSLSAAGFKLDPNGSTFAGGRSMEVTIQVQNLRQLLTLLESSQDINEVTIQMPRIQSLHPLGEATLLRASDLGVSGAMATGVQVGKP